MGFAEDDRIRKKNSKKSLPKTEEVQVPSPPPIKEPLKGADVKMQDLKPMFGTTLMLVPPVGFHRCIKCYIAKPTETGFSKEDLIDSSSGFCNDCKIKWGHLVLTSSLKMRD